MSISTLGRVNFLNISLIVNRFSQKYRYVVTDIFTGNNSKETFVWFGGLNSKCRPFLSKLIKTYYWQKKIPSTDFLLQNICKTCNNEKRTVLDWGKSFYIKRERINKHTAKRHSKTKRYLRIHKIFQPLN